MRHSLLLAALLAVLPLQAQDKVTKTVLELGRTDNRTMEHADYIARNIGGRIVGSAALTEAEAWVKEQFESWGLEVMVQEAGGKVTGFDDRPIDEKAGRVFASNGLLHDDMLREIAEYLEEHQ